MIARILSLSTIATGAAAFGLVGYMQYDPLALTNPARIEPEATPALAVVESTAVAAIEPDPEVLEMPTFLITARPAVKPPAASIEAVIPCSPWRDLGVTYVENGEAAGVQRVRALCP